MELAAKKNSDIQKVPQIENISLSELLQWNTWLQKTMPNPPVLMFNKAEKTFVGNTFFVKVPIKGSTGMLYFTKGKSLEVVFIRQLSSENVKDAPYTGDYEVIDFNVFTQRIFSFNKGRIVSSKKVKILGSQSSGTSGYTTNRSWFGQLLYCLGHYILAVPKRDANGEWSECWGIGGGDGSSGGEQGTVQDMQPDIGGGGGINWATFLATVIVPTNGNEPDPLPFESMPGGGGNYTWVPFTPPSGSGSYVGIIGSNYEQVQGIEQENLYWFNSMPMFDFNIESDDLGPCLNEIKNSILANTQNEVINFINEKFGESTKFNIKFVIDSNIPRHGRTMPSPQYEIRNGIYGKLVKLNITIKVNPTMGGTKLHWALVFLHELLHAYFEYRITEAWGDPLKEQKLKDELEFLKAYNPNSPPSVTAQQQHEQIAHSYINKLVSALKQYHLISDNDLIQIRQNYPTLTVDQVYESIAWGGLMESSVNGSDITNAWNIFKTNNPAKADLYRIISSYEGIGADLAPSKIKCN